MHLGRLWRVQLAPWLLLASGWLGGAGCQEDEQPTPVAGESKAVQSAVQLYDQQSWRTRAPIQLVPAVEAYLDNLYGQLKTDFADRGVANAYDPEVVRAVQTFDWKIDEKVNSAPETGCEQTDICYKAIAAPPPVQNNA